MAPVMGLCRTRRADWNGNGKVRRRQRVAFGPFELNDHQAAGAGSDGPFTRWDKLDGSDGNGPTVPRSN